MDLRALLDLDRATKVWSRIAIALARKLAAKEAISAVPPFRSA
jgi:hypothetical protein